MASEGGRDEMDSLFEGMVLFNTSQMADDKDGGGDGDGNDDDVHQLQEKEQQIAVSPPRTTQSASQPLDENLFSDLTLITPDSPQDLLQLPALIDSTRFPPPPTTTAAAAALTAATDIQTTTPRSNRSEVLASSLSRQISTTRKKKRAGLRIGYARGHAPLPDDHDRSDLDSDLPPPPSSPPLPSESELGGSAPQQVQEEEEAICRPTSDSKPPSLCFPHSTVKTPVQSDMSDYTCSGEGKEVDPSHPHSSDSSVANGASSRDEEYRFVSDAQPTAVVPSKVGDLHAGDDQLNTTSAPNPFELSFEQIRAQISQKLRHVTELVASVSSARKDSTRRRRKAADAVNIASTSYRQLEKELEEACEAEDFETAERVSESLALAEKDKEHLAIALRHAEAGCDAVDSKMQEVLECQIAAEEECSSLLKTFAADAANNADLVQKNAEVASEKELDRWLSLTEDLELKKMELDIESHLINSARLVLSNSIELSVKDDRREREHLFKRKEVLTEELEKLLAVVKEKEMEIAETDRNIETVENRIADVVCSFQEVQSSLDTKYENMRSGLSQMELDNEALAKKKKEIDDFLSHKKDMGIKLQELAQISANEAKMYQEVVELRKSLVLFILKSREDKVRLAKTEDKLSEDVHMLRQEISVARASLQELSSTKSSFQQEIESLKQRLFFIDKRVPELEADKKVAAAARNFKEAARIATESKTLSVEKESLQIKSAGAVLELQKIEEEICNTVNRLQETEGQISTKEKEVAMARFERLLLIAGAAKAERSAALELGDLAEADMLLAEAEAAESEARKIQPVYNLKEEEFANLPKQYISMELVSNLSGKQLAELAASAYISTQ